MTFPLHSTTQKIPLPVPPALYTSTSSHLSIRLTSQISTLAQFRCVSMIDNLGVRPRLWEIGRYLSQSDSSSNRYSTHTTSATRDISPVGWISSIYLISVIASSLAWFRFSCFIYLFLLFYSVLCFNVAIKTFLTFFLRVRVINSFNQPFNNSTNNHINTK